MKKIKDWNEDEIGVFMSLCIVLLLALGIFLDSRNHKEMQIYCPIREIKIDDESEYHITYIQDDKLKSIHDQHINISVSYKYIKDPILILCIKRNLSDKDNYGNEHVNYYIVQLPIGYNVPIFND